MAICTKFDCDDDKPKIELTACGGTEPYTWSVVGGETPTQTDSGTSDRNTKIEPPTNTTPGEAGDAYARGHAETRADTCPGVLFNLAAIYNCAGVQTASCTLRTCSQTGGCLPITCEVCCNSCSNKPNACCGDTTGFCGHACCDDEGESTCEQRTNDMRTQTMKDNGCKPCSATMEGAIVSVTDNVGAVVSTIIRT